MEFSTEASQAQTTPTTIQQTSDVPGVSQCRAVTVSRLCSVYSKRRAVTTYLTSTMAPQVQVTRSRPSVVNTRRVPFIFPLDRPCGLHSHRMAVIREKVSKPTIPPCIRPQVCIHQTLHTLVRRYHAVLNDQSQLPLSFIGTPLIRK